MLRIPAWPQSIELRAWQARALEQYYVLNRQDFFLSATPGAGKTTFAMKIAHTELSNGVIDRIVVVVNTENLKRHWAKAAKRIGIDLQSDFENKDGSQASDYQGMAITYQQMASSGELHRLHCKQPTLVIFDEVHHLADDKTWGAISRHAFSPAVRRLSLSGTPFRSDKNAIPFLTYGPDGQGIPDFRYGYEEALADTNTDPEHGVCRPVYFPSYEGEMEWRSGGKDHNSRFDDQLSQHLSAERLRTAITAVGKGEWLYHVLQKADQKLTEVREEGHRDAAGLVIAMDQDHAKSIADILLLITGASPALVISREPDSASRIEAFKEGSERWIVAVKMVSEGVDIARLRVAVYATNVTTEMAFRQAVGRVIRWIPRLEYQAAYFYIPRHPAFVEFAEQIKIERKHQCEEIGPDDEMIRNGTERQPGDYRTLGAIAFRDVTIALDGQFSSTETVYAESIRQVSGVQITTENLVKVLRAAGVVIPHQVQSPVEVPAVDRTGALLEEEKARVRKQIKSRAYLFALWTGEKPSLIHTRLNSLGGVRGIKEESLEGLEKQLERISEWMDAWKKEAEADAVQSVTRK